MTSDHKIPDTRIRYAVQSTDSVLLDVCNRPISALVREATLCGDVDAHFTVTMHTGFKIGPGGANSHEDSTCAVSQTLVAVDLAGALETGMW